MAALQLSLNDGTYSNFPYVKLFVSSVETNRFTARNTLFCYLF